MPLGKPRLSVTFDRKSPQCGQAIFGVVMFSPDAAGGRLQELLQASETVAHFLPTVVADFFHRVRFWTLSEDALRLGASFFIGPFGDEMTAAGRAIVFMFLGRLCVAHTRPPTISWLTQFASGCPLIRGVSDRASW